MPRKLAAVLLAVAFVSGCGQEPGFTAKLTDPVNVDLSWPDDDANVAGRIVEYTTDPQGPYTILQFVPPRQTTYRHPDLMPETRFYYRIRPFYGAVSGAVTVSGPASAAAAGPPVSLRTDGQAAAPAAFRAEPAPEDMVRFSWTDHSSDEDGFLVEIKKPGADGFVPIEVSDPGTTSAGLASMPGEEGASYRLRAFYYGPASPVLDLVSGKDG
ncbi:fibronectin type III domain-containing protein [Amycolatopsis alba]|uniref:Fibronectin type III domain-containing protein n=1 Tax=Amycolatopsis alba DSM 44262 TaxID=1125972 RepID=A0A229RMJ4_AMYAL|nr:fibronectin type III domain-containing protein [Amycolatopsis alba]OXM47873.1 fibronectin type III domain-containing protein [Amycolatopsis alba DSM 44262]